MHITLYLLLFLYAHVYIAIVIIVIHMVTIQLRSHSYTRNSYVYTGCLPHHDIYAPELRDESVYIS